MDQFKTLSDKRKAAAEEEEGFVKNLLGDNPNVNKRIDNMLTIKFLAKVASNAQASYLICDDDNKRMIKEGLNNVIKEMKELLTEIENLPI